MSHVVVIASIRHPGAPFSVKWSILILVGVKGLFRNSKPQKGGTTL